MKRKNGENIILSSDITIESGSNRGKNLDEILEKQDSEIRELKSNVKWVFKYGGVGSGKGGGGGTSTSWSIFARLGGETINGETLIFPQPDQYELIIRINNPSGGVFSVTYECGGTIKKTVRLDIDNAWTLEEKIFLNSNSKIHIDVLDGNAEIKSVESNYITKSYTLNYKLVEDSGIDFTRTKVFTNYLESRGLKAVIDYSVIDGIDSFSYNYRPFGSTNIIPGEISTKEIKEGTIELEAFDFQLPGQIPEDFIGTFTSNIDINVKGKISSFTKSLTILPGTLYLQVEPVEGEIYKNKVEDLDTVKKYFPGSVSFFLTAYFGDTNYGRVVEYTISTALANDIDDVESITDWEKVETATISERETIRVTLRFPTDKIGWNVIKFFAKDLISSDTTERYVFIYIDHFNSELNWYPISLQAEAYNVYKNVFHYGITGEQSPGFHINSKTGPKLLEIINQTINSNDITYLYPDQIPAGSPNDCLVSIGIQYNSTSDKDRPILDIAYAGNNGVLDNVTITVCQNKVKFGDETVGEIYLGTELEGYDSLKVENYHLISVYRRYVDTIGSTDYFEICVYIDGILEAALPNYISYSPTYNLIRLYPNNYFINTLELSHFPHGSENDYLTDTGIVRYWYTYKERMQRIPATTEITRLLNFFEGTAGTGVGTSDPGVYLDGARVAVRDDSVLAGIVANSNTPVMVITYDEANIAADGGFFKWSELHYSDDSVEEDSKKTVGIKWASASEGTLQNIKYKSNTFSLGIQGSSTKSYASKNYTLKLEGSGESGYIPLFSPNFDPNNSDTFLPEQSFTLKADVVDSGHSNNTCMGAFINKVTKKFTDSTLGNGGANPSDKYSNFVKNCLEGFPFLLFLEITHPNGDTVTNKSKYYYLGIYNFNLGRKSYFNLGYSDVSYLPNPGSSQITESGSFRFCEVAGGVYNPKTKFTCAEIAFNEGWFDFSAYDKSILFKKNESDTKFMFDDIVTGEQNPGQAQNNIANFVEATARAGGYIFTELRKSFGDHADGYRIKGQVPEYDKYYEKFIRESIVFIENEDKTSEFVPVTQDDLLNYVGAGVLDPNNPRYTVDYRSLVEYYTICMIFGLVDSVQKNLTIKTWDGKKFYFAFYDMDTCLGINNNGSNSTYYAFSDLWEGEEQTNGDVVTLKGPVTIYRDHFSPRDSNIVGYDVPSNYAFAVAKYFKSIIPKSLQEGYEISPQSLWARWRNKNSVISGYGVLPDADYFIDNFYLSYMKNVNELMFNYNYRQKYLRKTMEIFEGQTAFGYDYRDISRFHGRRVEYIRDWLIGRFHILDAYFNLSSSKVSLNPAINDFNYSEQLPESGEVDKDNRDIYVIRDIFSSGSQSVNDYLSFTVQAPDFSPLVISRGEAAERYILSDSKKKYSITIDNTGTNKIILGGSALWTYLSSIDGLIYHPMNISSERLRNLNGTRGTVGQWILNLPALQTLSLTSPGYSGTLTFDGRLGDSYPNLRSIDIHDSNLSLEVYKEGIKTVDLTNVGSSANNSPSVIISACSNLNNVTITGAKLYQLTVTPVWSDEIEISNNNIQQITLTSATGNTSLTISDYGLTTLSLSDFSKVKIGECSQLTKVFIKGSNLSSLVIDSNKAPNLTQIDIEDATNLKALSLEGCMNLQSLSLRGDVTNIETLNLSYTRVGGINYVDDTNTVNLTTLDLTPMTSLKSLKISGNPAIETVKVLNLPEKPIEFYAQGATGSLNPHSTLKRVYGHIKITESGALANLSSSFKLLGDSDEWNGVSKTSNKTPLEIIANLGVTTNDITSTEPPIPTSSNSADIINHHTTICKIFDSILNRESLTSTEGTVNNGTGEETINTGKSWFIFGNTATNITFGNNNRIDSVLSNICSSTPVSQFEIYYILNAFAISAARCIKRGGTIANQSLGNSFRYSGGDRFNYASGMHPNRYMFYGCSKITSLGQHSITSSAGTTKLLSPSHDPGGTIICDNGLFSPLTGLTYIGVFISSTVYMSRFLFRRSRTTSKYPISTFNGFLNGGIVCDEVDTSTKNEVDNLITDNNSNNNNLAKFGDFTEFFDNIYSVGGSITESFSPEYLNFSTLKVSIALAEISSGFNPKYGYGVINLSSIFELKNRLTKIANSFKISDANINYQTALNNISGENIDSGGRALFPIKTGMFEGFTALKYIGANDTIGSTGNTVNGYTRISVGDSRSGELHPIFGFTGSGLLKYIDQKTFPYDIFRPLGSNLETCPGFLAGLTTYGNNSFGTGEGTYFEFPGNLFKDDNPSDNKSNINLRDVAAFLKNCKIPYKLTENGFSKCTNLENITEIFYGSVSSGDICSRLIGSIPPRLFYHGSNIIDFSNTYYGTNEDPEVGELNAGDYYNDEHKVVISGKTVSYTKNIKYAYAAFTGCAGVDPYEFKINENFGKIDSTGDYLIENESIEGEYELNIQPEFINPNYTYWKYITVDGNSWKSGDTKLLDISLIYDGNIEDVNESIRNISTCEENFDTVKVIGDTTQISTFINTNNDKLSNPTNFICSPDLFLYFYNNGFTNIQYMFSYCGLPASREMNFSNFRRAMTGRICPYLLKPISNIESLAGLFRYCSGLSSVKYANINSTEEEINDLQTYLIPPKFFSYATKVAVLAGTFSGTYFEPNPNLNVFFPYLTKNLDIRGIFAWCGYTPVQRMEGDNISFIFNSISGSFINNSFSLVSGAFSAYPISIKNDINSNGGTTLYETGYSPRRYGDPAWYPKFGINFPDTSIFKSLMWKTYYVYNGHGHTNDGGNANDTNIYNVSINNRNYS